MFFYQPTILIVAALSAVLAVPYPFGHSAAQTMFGSRSLCAWGYGEVWTISEANHNVSSRGNYFEVSQKVDDYDGKKKGTPKNRVYTIIHLSFSGFGENGCSLIFNMPKNATSLYTHGPTAFVAKAFNWTDFYFQPTWDTVMHSSPSKIGPTFGSVKNVYLGETVIMNDKACDAITHDFGGQNELGFIFETDPSVHETSMVKFNQTATNSGLVTGPYMSFNC